MYKLHIPFGQTKPSSVNRLSDGASMPFDIQNVDYVAYLKWVSEGNVATPADEVTA
jgi:hypothetical protein